MSVWQKQDRQDGSLELYQQGKMYGRLPVSEFDSFKGLTPEFFCLSKRIIFGKALLFFIATDAP